MKPRIRKVQGGWNLDASWMDVSVPFTPKLRVDVTFSPTFYGLLSGITDAFLRMPIAA